MVIKGHKRTQTRLTKDKKGVSKYPSPSMDFCRGKYAEHDPTEPLVAIVGYRVQTLSAGNYTCELEWAGRPESLTHSLTVLQPPAIRQPVAGSHFQRDQGGQLAVTCRAEGDPPPQADRQYLYIFLSFSQHFNTMFPFIHPGFLKRYCNSISQFPLNVLSIPPTPSLQREDT